MKHDEKAIMSTKYDAEIAKLDLNHLTLAAYSTEAIFGYAERIHSRCGDNEVMFSRYLTAMREVTRRKDGIVEDETLNQFDVDAVFSVLRELKPWRLVRFPEHVVLDALEKLASGKFTTGKGFMEFSGALLIHELEMRMEDEGHPIYEMSIEYCQTGDLLEDCATMVDMYRGIRNKQQMIREAAALRDYTEFSKMIQKEFGTVLPAYDYRDFK